VRVARHLLTERTGYLSQMTVIVAAEHGAASALAARAETAAEATIWTHAAEAAEESVSGLAQAMLEFEAEASGRQFGTIVLADDSDAALAAALVGAKLAIEVLAADAAREAPSTNGRLIAQLAAAYTAPA
jgi:hypothetical protein